MSSKFKAVFPEEKSVIGMLHLAGSGQKDRMDRLAKELEIYQSEGLHGVIVEDYHGSLGDVSRALNYCAENSRIPLGVNILEFPLLGLEWVRQYGVKFVQFDSVNNWEREFAAAYNLKRAENPEVIILGGVRFKYQKPTGKSLEDDVAEGKARCEAIVTTGEGTGIETPLSKLREFRGAMGDYPLIAGAGVTAQNVRSQIEIADAVIVGSYFKNGDTQAPVNRQRVRDLMKIVNDR